MTMTLKEKVAKNSSVQGECLLWGGSVTKWGRPVAYITEKGVVKQVDLQLHLARKKFDLPCDTKVKITTTCGNPNCITKKHIEIGKVEKSHKGRKKRGTKCADADLNIAVFRLLATHTPEQILLHTSISLTTLKYIMRNKAMLPFLQMRLQWHLGDVPLSSLWDSPLTDNQLKIKYGISQYAVEFIRSKQSFSIFDEDRFVNLLRECYVMGEHLVWKGKVLHNTPLLKTTGSYHKNAVKEFKCAVTGIYPYKTPSCICGEVDCINPFHLE